MTAPVTSLLTRIVFPSPLPMLPCLFFGWLFALQQGRDARALLVAFDTAAGVDTHCAPASPGADARSELEALVGEGAEPDLDIYAGITTDTDTATLVSIDDDDDEFDYDV